MRIGIFGAPDSGKSSFADRLGGDPGVTLYRTDHYIELGWSVASQKVCDLLTADTGPLVVEGVAVPRALRKWLRANAEGRPLDALVYMATSFRQNDKGQAAMAKGMMTVFAEIAPELRARGVKLLRVVHGSRPGHAAATTGNRSENESTRR